MSSIKDDRGFNQGFELVKSTKIRMKRRANWIMGEFESGKKSVLEIGCGRGEVSNWIAEQTKMDILATDLCVPFIESAKEKYQLPNLKFEVLDFNNASQVNGRKFDYIIGNGILHHLYYNLPQALTAIKSLLNKNGKMIFMEPNIYNPYCALIFKVPILRIKAHLEPDEMAFSKSFISNELSKTGFSNIKVSYKDFLLPGVPDFAIKPLIQFGNIAERIPGIKMLSQSIFIVAENS
jgi:2-polyprenyl-3-methyl-5-hydroxy-6-metoxy-1,4-benzoquinol methylase